MYPRIPRELVADPLGSAEHTLGTTSLEVRIEMITCGAWLKPNFAVLDEFLKQLRDKHYLILVQLYVLWLFLACQTSIRNFFSPPFLQRFYKSRVAYLQRTLLSTVLAVT